MSRGPGKRAGSRDAIWCFSWRSWEEHLEPLPHLNQVWYGGRHIFCYGGRPVSNGKGCFLFFDFVGKDTKFQEMLYKSILFPSSNTSKELHVSALQRYAKAACADGLDLATLKDLSSLATGGKHMGNVERDLHRMIPYLYGSEFPLHSLWLEVYNPDSAAIEEREIPVLLASDVLSVLWKKQSPKLWDLIIGCDSSKATSFWSSFRSDPAFANHPVIQLSSSIETLWI